MRRGLLATVALAVLLAGCGEDASPEAGKTGFPPLPTMQRDPAHLGQTLNLMRIGDQPIAVRLDRVINPATVPHGWGESDKTYLAAAFTLTNNAMTTIVGNANSDVSVVGSDGTEYHADFHRVTECEDFTDGWFLVASADSVAGCVVFALPHGVAPRTVRYSPSSGMSRDIGEWALT